MSYINDFAVQRISKNAAVEFFEYVMSLLELCESLKTNLPEQYSALKTASAEVQKWGELTLKSNLTVKIHDLDSQRDSLLVALDHALLALTKSLDPETKEKAIMVKNKFDSINVSLSAQYFQESGAIDRLLGSLLGEELVQEVTAIGVLPIVNMIKAANDEMHQLLLERGIDEAKIPEQAFEKARRSAEAVYREFVFMVNAYIAMYVERTGQPDADLATFVQNLNQFLRKFKKTQLKSSSKDENALTPPDTNEETTESGDSAEDQPGSGEDNGGEQGGDSEDSDNTPTKRTATWKSSSGTVLHVQEYEVGATIVAPEPPTGFTWGYYPATMPDRDLTITAVESGSGV